MTRDEAVREVEGDVHNLARRLDTSGTVMVDPDDLVSAGFIGALQAWERFDPSAHVKFRSFAYHRIRGAMVDELRQWSLRKRRTLRNLEDLGHAQGEYFKRHGERISHVEAGELLDLTPKQVRACLVQNVRYVSLDDVLPTQSSQVIGQTEGAFSLKDSLADELALPADKQAALSEFLAHYVAIKRSFPLRLRQICELIFEWGLTLKQTGDVVNRTEGAICRSRKQIRNVFVARLGGVEI